MNKYMVQLWLQVKCFFGCKEIMFRIKTSAIKCVQLKCTVNDKIFK